MIWCSSFGALCLHIVFILSNYLSLKIFKYMKQNLRWQNQMAMLQLSFFFDVEFRRTILIFSMALLEKMAIDIYLVDSSMMGPHKKGTSHKWDDAQWTRKMMGVKAIFFRKILWCIIVCFTNKFMIQNCLELFYN